MRPIGCLLYTSVRHILLLRSIQKRTGGFTEFVPLGFVHEKTRLYKHGGARAGAQREDHLRVHALSRVLLHGAIRNLQVSWVKLGFDLSLECLKAGANDFSGTLMEESISKAAGANFGEFVCPEEFRRMKMCIRDSVKVAIRAGDILLATQRPVALSARNILEGKLVSLEQRGRVIVARIEAGVTLTVHITASAVRALELTVGRPIWVVLKTHSCHLVSD